MRLDLRYYIEIDLESTFALSNSDWSIANGVIRLTSNKDDEDTYSWNNNILQVSQIDNAVDLTQLSGARYYNNFELSILDNGLYNAIENSELTLKNKKIVVYTNVNGTSELVYKGVITSIDADGISINLMCEDRSVLEPTVGLTTIGSFNKNMRIVKKEITDYFIFNASPTADNYTKSLKDGDKGSIFLLTMLNTGYELFVNITFPNQSVRDWYLQNVKAIEKCGDDFKGTGDVYPVKPFAIDAGGGSFGLSVAFDITDDIITDAYPAGDGWERAQTPFRFITSEVRLKFSDKSMTSTNRKSALPFTFDTANFTNYNNVILSKKSKNIITENNQASILMIPESLDFTVCGATVSGIIDNTYLGEINKSDFQYNINHNTTSSNLGYKLCEWSKSGLASFFNIITEFEITDELFLSNLSGSDTLYIAIQLEGLGASAGFECDIYFEKGSYKVTPAQSGVITTNRNVSGFFPMKFAEVSNIQNTNNYIDNSKQYQTNVKMGEKNFNSAKMIVRIETKFNAPAGTFNGALYFQAFGIDRKTDVQSIEFSGGGEKYTNDPYPLSEGADYPLIPQNAVRYLLNTRGGYVPANDYEGDIGRSDTVGATVVAFQNDGTLKLQDSIDQILKGSSLLLTGIANGKRKLINLALLDPELEDCGQITNILEDGIETSYYSDSKIINGFRLKFDKPFGGDEKYYFNASVNSSYTDVIIDTNASELQMYSIGLSQLTNLMLASARRYKVNRIIDLSMPHLGAYLGNGFANTLSHFVSAFGFKRTYYKLTCLYTGSPYSLGDSVYFEHISINDNNPVTGTVQGVSIDIDNAQISYEILGTSNIDDVVNVVYQSGTSSDRIIESGTSANRIIQGT